MKFNKPIRSMNIANLTSLNDLILSHSSALSTLNQQRNNKILLQKDMANDNEIIISQLIAIYSNLRINNRKLLED